MKGYGDGRPLGKGSYDVHPLARDYDDVRPLARGFDDVHSSGKDSVDVVTDFVRCYPGHQTRGALQADDCPSPADDHRPTPSPDPPQDWQNAQREIATRGDTWVMSRVVASVTAAW